MILGIDVGNSNIVLGCIEESGFSHVVRLHTDRTETSEEYAIKFQQILELNGVDCKAFEGAIISSVVPEITESLRLAVNKLTGVDTIVVGPGIKTGLNIRIDDPSSIGADLITGSVGAMSCYGSPIIVVDIGTATTITLVDRDNAFRGGAIIPGVKISYAAIAAGTSLLPNISITPPKKVIGSNTADCMRSGAVFGTAAMIDGMLERMQEEIGYKCKVVATGGMAPGIVACCKSEIICDDDLLLKGLKVIYQKNR